MKTNLRVTFPDQTTDSKKAEKHYTHVVAGKSTKSGKWYSLKWVDGETAAKRSYTYHTTGGMDLWYSEIAIIAVEDLGQIALKPIPEHTCQLCGRHHKDNNADSFIAIHGYEVRWHQFSGRCPGSRHLPYEFNCSLIPPVIEQQKSYIETQTAFLLDFAVNPPEKLTKYESHPVRTVDYHRPEGFNPRIERYYGRDCYENEYFSTISNIKTAIRRAQEYLAWLEPRLANWVDIRK